MRCVIRGKIGVFYFGFIFCFYLVYYIEVMFVLLLYFFGVMSSNKIINGGMGKAGKGK